MPALSERRFQDIGGLVVGRMKLPAMMMTINDRMMMMIL